MAAQCQNLPILDVALLGNYEWEASPVEGQSLQQKDKKMRKEKGKKTEKPEDIAQFFVQNLKILISVHPEQKCHKTRH